MADVVPLSGSQVATTGELLFRDTPATSGALLLGDTGAANTPQVATTGELLFRDPPATSGALLFGDGSTASPAPSDVTLAIAGAFPALTATALVAASVSAYASGSFAPLSVTAFGEYDSNTQRPAVGAAASPWQVAQHGAAAGLAVMHQDASPSPAAIEGQFERAQSLASRVEHQLPSVLVPLPLRLQASHQDGAALQQRAGFAYQQGVPQALQAASQHQDAQRLHQHTSFSHQDGLRYARAMRTAAWERARAQHIACHTGHQKARPLRKPWRAWHQDGVPPPPGITIWVPPEPPKPPPCYKPGLPVELLFADPHDASQPAILVFRCDKDEPGPEPGGEPVVVPIRKVYIVINNITLTRVDSGAPLHALSFSASLDVDSWTWQWSASLHSSAADHLGRETDGSPPAVLATINGVPLRLVIERISLNEQFLPQVRYSVSGRGRAAVLSAPWAPVLPHGGQATARTAEQLANEVLQINGVSIGWGIDWQMPEWMVPPGLWSSSGSYIDALSEIATAVGATIQPHPTDAVLRIMPRYPRAPWEWGGLAPDFVIPAAAAQQISTEFFDKPAYNGVYVGGTQAGVFGPVVRTGTVGDVLAPQVTHPLITDATAQRLRGLAALSDTGKQRRVQLSMQVLPETGLIQPGKLVQIGTGASAYRGLVRSTAVEWAMPRLRQNIELEVHE